MTNTAKRLQRVAVCVWTVGLVWACLFVSLQTASAMQAEETGKEVKLNVGLSTAKPGEPIDIPLTLSKGDEPQVNRVVGEIGFPKDTLSFVDVELGLSGELSDVNVQAVEKADPNDDKVSLLEVTISGEQPIRPGILAYIKFRVSLNATKGTITLELKNAKATTMEGEPVQMAEGRDGQVELFGLEEEIPVVGCFFFTH